MREVKKKDLRNFGLALGAALIILGARLYFKCHNNNFLYLTAAGLLLLISGLVAPVSLMSLHGLFSRIARFIFGWLITNAVLISAFYAVVAPMGLLARLTGKDLLGLRIKKDSGSYWIRRDQKAVEPKQYEKQF